MKGLLVCVFVNLILFIKAQCPYNNNLHSNVTLASCPATINVTCINGGEYVSLNVIQGKQYTFTTCSNTTFDTEITLYNSTGTTVYGYNDDACGYQSILSWTASYTGSLHVLLDEYGCLSNSQCADLEISCDNPAIYESSNLPIVVIETAGGVGIVDAPKTDATMGIIYNGEGVRNYLTDPFNEYYGNIGIEIRGSSSQMFPKKSYGLETRDPQGNKFDVSMFNMAYDNDWVLYAPYSDKSLIRNVLTYKLGWDQNRYAPRTKLCEVIINGEYVGVYVLTEKIKNKNGKVGMDELLPEDLTDNELSGGYIVKIDKLTAGGVVAWESPYPPYSGASTVINYQMQEPEINVINPIQLNYIEDYITGFETALYGSNFTNPTLGYRPYIDVSSFIDFMLINEMGKNVDGYRISTYLHKHRISEGGKLVAGPLWDFNLAFGNADYCLGGNTDGWEINFNQYCSGGEDNPFWWKKFVQDPYFTNSLKCRWLELRQGPFHTDSILNYIDSLATYLDEAQTRNFQKWPVLGNYVWPNNFIGNTYQDEVNYLKYWITLRLNWMDVNMFGSCTNLTLEETNENLFLVAPNPSNGKIKVSFSTNENGLLQIKDMEGRTIFSSQLNGEKEIVLDLIGVSPGVYFVGLVNERSSCNRQIIIQ